MKYLISALLVFLVACGDSNEARKDAPVLKRWQSWPLDVALSSDLTQCQMAGIRASATYWESLTNRHLATFRVVSPTDISMEHATRKPFTVAVKPGAMNTPDILDQVELFELKHQPEFLHSAEVTLQGCTLRAFAHEFGHILGLGHAKGDTALMNIYHKPDAWDLSETELGSF